MNGGRLYPTYFCTFSPRKSLKDQYERQIGPLSERLVTRFGTQEAYNLFPDVVPTLTQLSLTRLDNDRPLRLALATNSDSESSLSSNPSPLIASCRSTCRTPTPRSRQQDRPTLSYFEKCAKPDPRFFHAAILNNTCNNERLEPANVLYVGDQLYEDFWAATEAGLQAAWLQRPTLGESNQPYQQQGEGKVRSSEMKRIFVTGQ